jgi:hypothetical protein
VLNSLLPYTQVSTAWANGYVAQVFIISSNNINMCEILSLNQLNKAITEAQIGA